MRIAFLQHRLGRTDGVSLEVDKWREVLEEMGHEVFYIAGNDDVPGGRFVPELYPFHPVTERIIRNGTVELKDYPNGEALVRNVMTHKDIVKSSILSLLDELDIDLLIPNNLQSVGYNLPGMVALYEILKETGMPAICHSHDFWWEDSGEVEPTCREVVELYEKYAPPDLPNVRHAVINRIAQRELKKRRGIDSTVVPNVFDFNRPEWKPDAYNRDFRAEVGIEENDIFLLQATRVLNRKAIELAIDLAAKLDSAPAREALESRPLFDGRTFGPEDRVVLVCAGYVEGIGLTADYRENLVGKAERLGVRVIWAGDRVRHTRDNEKGTKIYSLWDSYACADFVTYPSVWEGWGNQLIEAVFAKLPVALFEYPVYVTDLKDAGFDVVSLGDRIAGHDDRGLVRVPDSALDSAASEAVELLVNPERRKEAVERNFEIARERYSLEALSDIVSEILNSTQARG